jgi:tripartite-type tricarboxylate transporter receptor subunit TctC
VVKKLDEAFKVALEDKDVVATLEKYDMAPRYMPAAAYDKFARALYVEEKAGLEKLGLAAKS